MRYLVLLLALWSLPSTAVVETYDFESEVLRERYHQFTAELRCPKCQNQNLSGSNSPIAKDLRRELYRLLHEGSNDQQIVDFMVDRYGDFILYRPRFNLETALLWLAPAIFLVLGMSVLVTVYLRQRRAVDGPGAVETLDDEERQQLARLLQRTDDDLTANNSKDKR